MIIDLINSPDRKSSFGFGSRKPRVEPTVPVEAQSVVIGDLSRSTELSVAEMDLSINHTSSGHEVILQSEKMISAFWSNLSNLVYRRDDYDKFGEIEPLEKTRLSSFEISSVSPVQNEEQDLANDSTLSFYIDGEAYTPCKITGALLPDHVDIIRY